VFLSAYLGAESGFAAWQRAVAWHAHWLGLTSHVERRRVAASGLLGLAWLEHPSRRGRHRFFETELGMSLYTLRDAEPADEPMSQPATWNTLAAAPDANVIRLRASWARRELVVVVPPTTPEQFYFARTRDGWVMADDLRLFPHLIEVVLDETAIYALFQYSAIPPALTLYAGVRRVPNGHVMRFRIEPPATECTPFFNPLDIPPQDVGEPEAERRIQEVLDARLVQVPRDTVLYFSGGVDSGLIAARLARLGRSDVRLVNYAFDAQDEQHQVAVRMASHLGLTCELVHHVPEEAADVLDRASRDYSFPFGDISTIPTNVLVHGSFRWASQGAAVIEGTGADGAYGLAAEYPKWRRTYGVPHPLREQIAKAYGWLRLWRFDARVERAAHLFRKSAGLPLPFAVVAQNALGGIAYEASPDMRERLARAVAEYLDVITHGATPEDQVSLLDLVWVCAGRMAPKSFDPLRLHGIRPIYPFLEPAMVTLSTALPWATKCAGAQAKGILKRLLAREVPPELVYRRKIGFTRSASARAVFASRALQDYLRDVVLSPDNPVRNFWRPDVVRGFVDRARDRALSGEAYIFLWTIAFLSAWLRQRQGVPARTGWIPDPAAHTGPADTPVGDDANPGSNPAARVGP
jgi:asparagine synthase (glutamine-hydrolysing)